MPEDCILCSTVVTYADSIQAYVESLAVQLLPSMRSLLYLSLVALFIIEGVKMTFGKIDLLTLAVSLVFATVSSILMEDLGAEIIVLIFDTSIFLMVGGASLALSGASQTSDNLPLIESSNGPQALAVLVDAAEAAIGQIFQVSQIVMDEAGWSNWTPVLIAILMVLPYLAIVVILAAQIVVGIFRLLCVSAFMPYLFILLPFQWGRERVIDGVNTLLASIFIIFAVCVVLGLVISGVNEIAAVAASHAEQDSSSFVTFDNKQLIVVIALGWMCGGLMTEATGFANSIARTQLTNTAVGTMVAGAGITAAALAQSSGRTAYAGANLATGAEAQQRARDALADRMTGVAQTAAAAAMPARYVAQQATKALTGKSI